MRPSTPTDQAEEDTCGSPGVAPRLGLSSGELQPGMRKIHLTWGASTDTFLQPWAELQMIGEAFPAPKSDPHRVALPRSLPSPHRGQGQGQQVTI